MLAIDQASSARAKWVDIAADEAQLAAELARADEASRATAALHHHAHSAMMGLGAGTGAHNAARGLGQGQGLAGDGDMSPRTFCTARVLDGIGTTSRLKRVGGGGAGAAAVVVAGPGGGFEKEWGKDSLGTQ